MTAELVPPQGGELDAELLAGLPALDEATARHVRKPRNTERNYAGDWRTWQRYAAQLRIPERAATIGSFAGFVLWLRRDGKAPATVERRVYGVTVTLRSLGVEVPQEAADGARLALEAYRRDLAEAGETRGRGRAGVVTIR
ncbi:integrase, partial [Nonomuraea zeae]